MQKTGDQRIGAVHFRRDESGHFARHFVFGADAAGEHFRRPADGPQRIAQLVGKPGGELPQRGQTVGTAHGHFRLLDLKIGRRELFGRAQRSLGLYAQTFGERVGQRPHHRQKDCVENQFGLVECIELFKTVQLKRSPAPIDEEIEGKIGGRGDNGNGQCSANPKRGGS